MPFSLKSEDEEESHGRGWGSGKRVEVGLPWCTLTPLYTLGLLFLEHKSNICVFFKKISRQNTVIPLFKKTPTFPNSI